jgi:hypothetical protein|tara:strand:+ start:17348 stop:17947 length:600 start_codon:yes stop_codon:yes gene_type:complete
MKRILPLIIIIALSACTSKAPPKNTTDVCKIFKEKYSWYKAAKKTEKRWKIPVSVSMAIIKQESSFIADARPQRTKLLGFIPWKRITSARGYAQAVDGTWEMYLKDRGGWFVARNDFEDAVDFIGWYNYKTHKQLNISMTNARALYLAYHEGRGGYRRGSYRTKPWLLSVADKVQRNANRYDAQYQGCKKKLGKRFIFF